VAAGTYHMKIEKGSTLSLVLTYTDANDAVINLSGYTARMQIRKRMNDSNAILEATTENGYITLGGSAGTVTISIPASVTATLDTVEAVYDIELVNNSIVTRLVEGTVEVSPEVTR